MADRTAAAAAIAILKTLLFTVFVPGTVTWYIPWSLRTGTATTVTWVEAWAAIAVMAIGVAIYLHTAFSGFA
jgi:hypothetical protein